MLAMVTQLEPMQASISDAVPKLVHDHGSDNEIRRSSEGVLDFLTTALSLFLGIFFPPCAQIVDGNQKVRSIPMFDDFLRCESDPV